MAIKQKIIIFEGHDESGKTTIAKELSKFLKIPYFKSKRTNEYIESKIHFLLASYFGEDHLLEFLEQTRYSVILDRSYPSNYIYSKIFDRPIDFTFFKELDARYSKLKAKIIICTKNIHSVGFKDLNVSFGNLKNIKEKYYDFRCFTSCRTIALDTTDENLERQIKTIIDWLDYDK